MASFHGPSGPDGSNMQDLESGHGPSHSTVDIYDLKTISKLQNDPEETFFSRYAKGDWASLHPMEIPPDIAAEMPVPSTSTSTSRSGQGRYSEIGYMHGGELNGFRPGTRATTSNQDNKETTMHIDLGSVGGPPDLMQSVEDVYRSFISDGHRTSHSNLLPTPLSEASGFPFTGGEWETKGPRATMMHVEPVQRTRISPDGYAAHHAKRFAELGYLEAPMPFNEQQRRRALRVFKPFHTKMDPNLDRIARLGKSMFAANASLISLVDADEVQFTFNGRDPYMVPRGTPMCSHAVLLQNDEPLVVLDTLKDWRFKGNKVVTDELSVRFYAGYPLRTETGENVGVFCILDNKPRAEFGEEERKQLKELTDMTYRELQGLVSQKQRRLQEQLQFSIETFNREAVTGGYAVEHLLRRIVDHISYALTVEGVLIFDALGTPHNRSTYGELQAWHDRAGQPVPIMAASEHATHLSEISNPTRRNSVLDLIFHDYPNGLLYTQGDELPSTFVTLLPESVTAAAAVPVSRGENEPYALICIYTLQPDYHFQLPDATLSFLSSMGLILCGVQQKQVLSLADKAKVDFIANISHELRTPLHGVIASCDLLAETSLSDTQESFLSTAKQCASSLTETINHVLDFTKSTSQTGHRREAVDLSQLIEETMIGCWLGRTTKQFSSENSTVAIGGLYAPPNLEQSDSDSHSVTKVEPLIEIEPQSNWTVMVDKAGLRRILINLIGNSMKFTQDGYVKLSLSRAVETNPSSVPIEIVVEDTGSGISGSFVREKLFHPFSQEKPFSQGIGLGLAIVRAILKSPSIDGSIDVQSQVGKGTRMSLRFDAPLVLKAAPVPWFRCPSPVVSNRLPLVSFVGFSESSLGSKLAQLLRQHLGRWYGEIEESNPGDAKILIIDADYINPDILSEPLRRHQTLLLLASSPIDKSILKAAQELSLNGGFCLVNLKPIGPHGLSKLLSRMVDSPLAKTTSINRSTSVSPKGKRRASTSTYSPRTTRKNSLNEVGTMSTALRKPSSEGSGSLNPTAERLVMPRALVVEDNPVSFNLLDPITVNRKVLSAYLRLRGFEYVEAGNGQEGVTIFESHPSGHFDICLMDLQMPVMDGFNATSAIREIEKRRMAATSLGEFTGRLKVYALSGLAAPEDKERAATIGFDGYLVKPVELKTLDDVFQSLPPSARWRVPQ